jgi:chaperone required for assembly of F1-ATPase
VKRFWDNAGIAPAGAGFAILLDGKPMHLPGGATLEIAAEALARAVAAEWQHAGGAKGGEMSFADTPLTRLAGTAQERVTPDPAPVMDALSRYGETDLLCYRADRPPDLVHRQAREWQPWLDWAALTYDAPLKVTSGIVRVPQDAQALRALRRAVVALDVDTLAALGVAVPAMGSLVLGLALAERQLDATTAHRLAALDELFQAEFWGVDEEADRRRRAVAADIALAARFMELARR